jgi:hypothetical protein
MLKEGMKMEKRSGAQLLNDIPFAGTREKLNDNQINEAYDDWARLSGIKNK